MSNDTNFSAEFMGEKKAVLNDKVVAKFLKGAVKFKLPEGGTVIKVGTPNGEGSIAHSEFKDFIKILKLPYDNVVLEYFDLGDIDAGLEPYKVMVLASNSGKGKIAFEVVFRPVAATEGLSASKKWNRLPMKAYITDKDFTVKIASAWHTIQGISRNQAAGIILTEDECEMMGKFGYKLLCFIAALQCSNVIEVDAETEVLASNGLVTDQKTSSNPNPKTPLYSYKELVIDTKGKIEAVSNDQSESTSQSTKRIHLRRGHIRRYPDFTIWVNPCVVGDKSKGVVEKDYKVI